jgi:hypothetical protein
MLTLSSEGHLLAHLNKRFQDPLLVPSQSLRAHLALPSLRLHPLECVSMCALGQSDDENDKEWRFKNTQYIQGNMQKELTGGYPASGVYGIGSVATGATANAACGVVTVASVSAVEGRPTLEGVNQLMLVSV